MQDRGYRIDQTIIRLKCGRESQFKDSAFACHKSLFLFELLLRFKCPTPNCRLGGPATPRTKSPNFYLSCLDHKLSEHLWSPLFLATHAQTRALLERDEINLQFALVVSEWRVILPMMSQMPSAICVSAIFVSFLYICFLAAYVIEAI